jgi:hypothetical protein
MTMILSTPVKPASFARPIRDRDDCGRRNGMRRDVVLPCQAVREHDFKLIADRTLDVSTDGLLLPLRARVLTGDSLIVSFAIPGLWIDVEATVARVIHGRRPGDDGLAIGVVFDRIGIGARTALAGFLHGRRPTLPRRGPFARLRRGLDAPRLADGMVLERRHASKLCESSDLDKLDELVDLADIEDEDVDTDERESERDQRPDNIDGLGVLRAVVGAWQTLVRPADHDAKS